MTRTCSTLLATCIWLCSTSPALADPTPQEVAEAWANLSGGLAGKLVFWQAAEIRVLDLETGEMRAIADCNWARRRVPPYPTWSPDGSRILYQGPEGDLMVMYADGSRLERVGECIGDGSGWWGDDWVVHSWGDKIVRTQINRDNQALGTEVLVAEPPSGEGYGTVEMAGDYLCYTDSEANRPTGGYHRAIVLNWTDGTAQEVIPRDSDACGIRLVPDGSGTSIFHQETHWDPAVIQAFEGHRIGEMPPLPGRRIAFIRWSNHLDFLAHNDGDFYSPDEDQRAWLRKVSTHEHVFLGEDIWQPDVWIGSPAQEATPATPTHLRLTPLSATRVNLAWDDNSDDEDGFRIYRDAGQGFVPIGTTARDNPVYNDDSGVEGQTYTYRVVAYQNETESRASNEATITCRAPYVKLLSPAGGERLVLGDLLDVSWATNMPGFDASIRLSVDGEQTWTTLVPSWTAAGSSWTWKVGFKDVSADPQTEASWERVVTETTRTGHIRIQDYQGTPVSDTNATPFEIRVESDEQSTRKGTGCSSLDSNGSPSFPGLGLWFMGMLLVSRLLAWCLAMHASQNRPGIDTSAR